MGKGKKCKCPPPGAPAWMTTFADLMSLLMCFFVLLLAFSEMDVLKFKQLAGSMKYAFGVQHQIEVQDIPKGTSIIALEFRPGKPDDTPIQVLNQKTIDTTQSSLEFQPGRSEKVGGEEDDGGQSQEAVQKESESEQTTSNPTESAMNQQDFDQLKKLMTRVQEQVHDGSIEIESKGQEMIIRINEKGSFAAGSGFLQPRFKPIIRQIAGVLNEIPGNITVTGHTDDTQISNEMYRSNWDLSSRRSMAVVTEMLKVKTFDSKRLTLKAVADNEPRAPNNSPINKSKNRRVEISIVQGKPLIADPISVEKRPAKN
tara:strand:- start:460 stop:1401 length:942 start_codon:yes stop_codon:yes gene_type:complete